MGSKREAEDETTTASSPPVENKNNKKQKRTSGNDNNNNNNNNKDDNTAVKILEEAYRTALQAFKKDKTNKDLRRAKSAAKKAWDAAVLESVEDGNVTPITCKDCSQMFVWYLPKEEEEEQKQKEQQPKGDAATTGTTESYQPSRCEKCNDAFRNRLKDRTKRDSTGKNMCYDFQRGECTRGNRCRFSHNLEFGGNANKKGPIKPICHAFRKGNCDRGDKCRFRHEKVER